MKKVLFLILVFSLCFAWVFAGTIGVASAEHINDVQIKLIESFDDEELTVVARLEANDGFTSLALRVEFDTKELSLESVKHADTWKDLDPTDNLENVQSGKSDSLLLLYVGYGENTTETGELFTMKFRVKDGAVNGKKKVSLYITELAYKMADGYDTLNEKYSSEGASLDHSRTGGVLSAEVEYFVSNGVPAESIEEAANPTLVIVLAVVGGIAVVAGIVLAAYFAFRKKEHNKA